MESKWDDARASRIRAVEIALDLGRPRLAAVLLNRLGAMLEARGRVQEALYAYESGVRVLEETNADARQVVEALRSTSKGYQVHREPLPDLYSPSLATDLEEAEHSASLLVTLLVNIGNSYLRLPQEGPALRAYEQALDFLTKDRFPLLRAAALANRGEILRRQGRVDEAEVQMEEALALFEKYGEPIDRRRVLALLAGIARERGEWERAQEHYREALALYTLCNDMLGSGRTQAGLGHLFLAQGRYTEAEACFRQALKHAGEVQDGDTLWHAHWGIGRSLHEQGALEGAAVALQESLALIRRRQLSLVTDEGKVSFLDSVQQVWEELLCIYLDLAEADPSYYRKALETAEDMRGRALRDLIGHERRPPQRGDTLRGSRFRPFRDQQEAVQKLAGGIESWGTEQPPWVQMAPAVGSDAGESPGTGLIEEGEGEEERPLPPPIARLVFHTLEDKVAVFAVTPRGEVRGHVSTLTEAALEQQVAEIRAALGTRDPGRGVTLTRDLIPVEEASPRVDPLLLLERLYTLLVAPVADSLPEDGTPVVVEPDGALWLLPFAALRSPDGSWMGDRWPLLFSPSAAVLEEIRREPDYGTPASLTLLAAGNPTMPDVPPRDGVRVSLAPLAGAEREARAIAGLFPGERHLLLTAGEATADAVEEQARHHGILHLATHGIAYASDPLASFVALADSEAASGLLTARRVIDWDVRCDLVALSACQTGLGRISGDGIIGLCRAFLVAGARSVLVSQWSVSDEATVALMERFYTVYISLDNKALALQEAMRAVREIPGYEHPRYWAPFIIVGAEA